MEDVFKDLIVPSFSKALKINGSRGKVLTIIEGGSYEVREILMVKLYGFYSEGLFKALRGSSKTYKEGGVVRVCSGKVSNKSLKEKTNLLFIS